MISIPSFGPGKWSPFEPFWRRILRWPVPTPTSAGRSSSRAQQRRGGRETPARDGADPNKVNSKGNTPLWFAAQSPARPASDRIAVMGLLLDAGADIHKRCEDGTTALHFAAWRGPVEVVEYLLSRGARFWVTDDKDRTPKDHAVQMSNSPDKEKIIRLFSEVRILDPIFRSAVDALDAGDVEGLERASPEASRAREPACGGGRVVCRDLFPPSHAASLCGKQSVPA